MVFCDISNHLPTWQQLSYSGSEEKELSGGSFEKGPKDLGRKGKAAGEGSRGGREEGGSGQFEAKSQKRKVENRLCRLSLVFLIAKDSGQGMLTMYRLNAESISLAPSH